ncbi:hypothetical protein AGR7C_Lc20120 [Agrobacterium deltaense Zutra 3/1]|uniref:Uncharacterized protein n=1 Tax=Agrobacterium deltaense Zutra 3/1 TaxID=1183427 RepID=A0A1S7RLL0_9HYPH|nr:hypothetical protein AGR7C_Lc20120 [Agrobacterium deltaense Zutra 3/1]
MLKEPRTLKIHEITNPTNIMARILLFIRDFLRQSAEFPRYGSFDSNDNQKLLQYVSPCKPLIGTKVKEN